uniref:2'-5' RNA ligase n=1 Tax=Hirondellea gigas TaxID=1518452 RepID=A0A6A7GAU9_9CRUS
MKLEIVEILRKHGVDSVEKWKIKSNRHSVYPELICFKYSDRSPKATDGKNQVVNECRGIILNSKADFAVVSFPYTRFYNYGEHQSDDIDWKSAKVFEKLDGSLMTLYRYKGTWQVSSSGKPDAGGTILSSDLNSTMTMADLFWEIWHGLGYEFPSNPDKPENRKSYVFEMLSERQKISAEVLRDDIVLHGVRNLDTLLEESCELIAEEMNWHCARSHSLSTLEDVKKAANELSSQSEHPEGFVVCDANFHRIKVKNPSFVRFAHFPSLDDPSMRNLSCVRQMTNVIRRNEGSELLCYLSSKEWKTFHDTLKRKFETICDKIQTVYDGQKLKAGCDNAKQIKSILEEMKDSGINDVYLYFSGRKFSYTENLMALLKLMGFKQSDFDHKSKGNVKARKAVARFDEVKSFSSPKISQTVSSSSDRPNLQINHQSKLNLSNLSKNPPKPPPKSLEKMAVNHLINPPNLSSSTSVAKKKSKRRKKKKKNKSKNDDLTVNITDLSQIPESKARARRKELADFDEFLTSTIDDLRVERIRSKASKKSSK